MKFANANKLDRKSGRAQGRDLQFHLRAQANAPWANRLRVSNFASFPGQVCLFCFGIRRIGAGQRGPAGNFLNNKIFHLLLFSRIRCHLFCQMARNDDHSIHIANDDVARVDRDSAAPNRDIQINGMVLDQIGWCACAGTENRKPEPAITPLSRTGPSETIPATPRTFNRVVKIEPQEAAVLSPRQS